MQKLAYLGLLLVGCAKTDSSDLLTSGIYGGITASTTGDGMTHVSATLYVGNPIYLNFVELTGDDQLIASHNGQDKEMTETELLNIVGHWASFPTDAEGSTFEVAFLRTVDEGAPSSRATLPAKFTLDPGPTTASRAQALTVSWSPAASVDLMSWRADGDCIELAHGNIAGDTGMVTIAPDTLKKKMGETVPDSCNITLSIYRSRLGTLDPGYGKGGLVQGQQVRSATIMSTP